MEVPSQEILRILIEGGLGAALVKAIMVLGDMSIKIGEIAVKMESRLTALEIDAKWIKEHIGRRESDRNGGQNAIQR